MSAINAVTDFVLLVLPMPRLWGLHTSLNKKIQLMAIFALGAATVVVSIIRANYVSTVSFTNGTWQNAFGAMWSVVETYLAIVCACLPTLRPLYEKAFGKNGSTTNGSSGGRIIYPLSGRSGISWNRFKMNTFESKSADADKDSIDQSIHTAASERSFTRAEDNV